jgi:hypothetical protein
MATSRRGLPTITLQDPPPQGEVSGPIPIVSWVRPFVTRSLIELNTER